MKADLDREDVTSLLKGSSPHYDVMNKIPKDLGHYVGGFVDQWEWTIYGTSYTTEELYNFYIICKNSWK